MEEGDRAAALEEYAKLRQSKRLNQKRRGEADRYRRTMLAIHVPFEYAQKVAARADAEGMSIYAWIRAAINRAMT